MLSCEVRVFRIVAVVGTRPEAIKMFPVIKELEKSDIIAPYVVVTGQHQELCRDVLDMAGVRVDRELSITRVEGTINELAGQIMVQVGSLLEELRKDETGGTLIGTMVHGDTTSAMSAALASAQARVPVIHVEAGLRTYNPLGPFPEEINRQVISRLATIQIAPTAPNEANLVREQVSAGHVFVSGNTGIDALKWATSQTPHWEHPEIEEMVTSDRPFIVATLHRRENWGRLEEIGQAFNDITARRPDVRVLMPLHPNPAVRKVLGAALNGNPNVLLVEPMAYIPFAHALSAATLVITDSGGIQEEAPSVGTPVLVARDETERQEGVEAGTLILVGSDPAIIAGTAVDLLNDEDRLNAMKGAWNPFGDGKASQRIKAMLEYVISGGMPPNSYGTGISRFSVLSAAGYTVPSHARTIAEEEWVDSHADHDDSSAFHIFN